MVERELAGVRPSRPVEQVVDEARLSAETGQQCNIDVASLPRLAPPLHGQASDDRRAPSLSRQEALQLGRRREQKIHRRRRCKMRCCSTRPDHVRRAAGSGTRRAASISVSAAARARPESRRASSDHRCFSSSGPVVAHPMTYALARSSTGRG